MRVRLRLRNQSEESVLSLSGHSVYSVGRSGTDILVTDHRCSRRHAQLAEISCGKFVVQDLGSTNGLTLNGRPVRDAALRVGDVIGIGGWTLTIEELSSEGAETPSLGEAQSPDREGTDTQKDVVLNRWPDNLRSLPIGKLKEFVDYIEPEKRLKSVRLADLMRERKRGGK